MTSAQRPFAVITGASTGIGLELAKVAVGRGYDLVICADEAAINFAPEEIEAPDATIIPVRADLSTQAGIDVLYEAIGKTGRPVDALLANAGIGLGHGFLDQDPQAWKRVIDTNVFGTLALVHRVGRDMRARNAGRILVTGSIAGFMPGSFQAVYNGSKAFLDSFSFALRNELKDTKVTVTCLMPGATDTDFFERADMMDTSVGQAKKDDPAMVARVGFDAMLEGKGDVVSGLKNKIMTAIAAVTPAGMLAEQHRQMAEPKGDAA